MSFVELSTPHGRASINVSRITAFGPHAKNDQWSWMQLGDNIAEDNIWEITTPYNDLCDLFQHLEETGVSQ